MVYTLQYTATRRVATRTLQKLQSKIAIKYDIAVSIGSVFALKPFCVLYATEKERLLCLCKICLNNCLIFDLLMTSVDTDSKRDFDNSVSKFQMKECGCEKEKNGFCSLKCCINNCENCKEKKKLQPFNNLKVKKNIISPISKNRVYLYM